MRSLLQFRNAISSEISFFVEILLWVDYLSIFHYKDYVPSEPEKILFSASKDLLKRIDGFRLEHRISSRLEAMTRLLDEALNRYEEGEEIALNEKTKKEIEEIMRELRCPEDFRCYKSGLKTLCKAKDIGLKLYLQCLEEKPNQCKFSFCCRDESYCSCPLRVYIAKKVKR
jgi:hypothetical protein